MTEEEKPFRFLTDSEFLGLEVKERVAYLARAERALEDERRRLRGQAAEHIRKELAR